MKQKIIGLLKEYTNHNIIELTSRGNTAIFAALYIARKWFLDNGEIKKKIVLYPDQGGWISFYKYPGMLELESKKIKTDYGVIDLNYLKNIIKKGNVDALIYSTPAGYFAHQPIKEIYNICKDNCLVILDITGSIGTKLGNYADLMVASFGKWKPINMGYGGFVSIKNKDVYEKAREIFNTTSFDEKYIPLLLKKLEELPKRYELFNKINEKIKDELKDFDIIHRNKKGINVIVKFKDEKEKIINYCKNNNLEFTLCPRYIRVDEKAVSIEVKRLEQG
jgi:hypothetical protein